MTTMFVKSLDNKSENMETLKKIPLIKLMHTYFSIDKAKHLKISNIQYKYLHLYFKKSEIKKLLFQFPPLNKKRSKNKQNPQAISHKVR
jgi:D-hexose-6-phosphate mutarotase